MNNSINYFPGLDGIRFYAAILVVLSHIESFKNRFEIPTLKLFPISFKYWGDFSVTLFFVLSGYLITYLLIVEKQKFLTINVGKFYMRRILRIWPLYYFVLLTGFFIWNQWSFLWDPKISIDFLKYSKDSFFYHFLFLSNISLCLYAGLPYLGHTWSISVEEQFYLIWPVIIKYSSNILISLLTVLFLYLFLKLFVPYFIEDKNWKEIYKNIIGYTRISCMAIGGLGAYFIYNRDKFNLKFRSFIYSYFFQMATFLAILIIFYFQKKAPFIHHELISVVFVFFIINISTNPESLLKFNHPIYRYLGNLSFSIYLLHPIVLGVLTSSISRLIPENYLPFEILIIIHFLLSICFTILFAMISYRFIEKPFLKLKTVQEVVIVNRNL